MITPVDPQSVSPACTRECEQPGVESGIFCYSHCEDSSGVCCCDCHQSLAQALSDATLAREAHYQHWRATEDILETMLARLPRWIKILWKLSYKRVTIPTGTIKNVFGVGWRHYE